MNIDKLRDLLKEHKIYVKESSTDFVCICPICGDHKNPHKRGHLYVSKRVDYPVVHCFIGQCQTTLPDFIRLLTGSMEKCNEIITQKEINDLRSQNTKTTIKRSIKYEIPQLKSNNSFKNKEKYLLKRTQSKLDIYKEIPNLIFDFNEFLKINNITLSEKDEYLRKDIQQNFVCFLTHHQTQLICRACVNGYTQRYNKIQLQSMPFDLIDYYCINQKPDSNTIVIAEGIFDILGEYSEDSLKYKNKCHSFIACQSFSYSSVIRSFCFFNVLFDVDIVILSDMDKKKFDYIKTITKNQHIIKNIKLYYNDNPGGDFGSFPIKPIPLDINLTNIKVNRRMLANKQ